MLCIVDSVMIISSIWSTLVDPDWHLSSRMPRILTYTALRLVRDKTATAGLLKTRARPSASWLGTFYGVAIAASENYLSSCGAVYRSGRWVCASAYQVLLLGAVVEHE
jgi:hypothetical protein